MSLRPLLGAASCAALLLLGAATAAPPPWPPPRSTSPSTRRAGSPPTAPSPSPAPTAVLRRGTGPVFVSSSVNQSTPNVSYGIGGTAAVCDGAEHRWENSGKAPKDALKAGAAKVEATLMELRGSGILVIPVPHAVSHHDVTLAAAA